jgi:predicted ArsR family transcriptional regulator
MLFFYFLAKPGLRQSTNPVTLDQISQALNINKNIAKTTIIRLQKKGCINREFGREGRGGWSSFTISNTLYQDIMQQEKQGYVEAAYHITGNKQVTEQVTEQVTTSSSSSSVNNKTTTTSISEEISINIETLKDIGFI